MSNFMSAVRGTLNDEFNYSMTENGALGFRTTGKNLLDLNFAVSSLRSASDSEIVSRFNKAFFDDKITAMKWLFYTRDVRGGLGERRLFRVVLEHMARQNPEYIVPLLDLVPEYGRYDDLWRLLDTDLADNVMDIIKTQLYSDIQNMKKGKSISLLAKWLPSVAASSPTTKRYAKKIIKHIGVTERDYRKSLSRLRKYLDVVEVKMSAKEWSEIDYQTVPSRANLIYNSAFLRNDEQRRREFLSKLEKGEAKINAGTLFPHDIVHKYMDNARWSQSLKRYDAALEGLWKNLPDTVNGCGNTIVVADGSGSMTSTIGGTNVTALDVANALAIYFAERSSGQFKDQYITFSSRPQLVNLSKGNSLRDKIQIALGHNEVADTNVEAVFDLILTTAIRNKMSQDELPANILIISDMEFNACARARSGGRVSARLFDVIREKYEAAGYKLPRLVFWNVNSRTGTIPVKENDMGVALVSGFSANVVNMVMSGKLDPYECLLDQLNTERYAPIGEALKNV